MDIYQIITGIGALLGAITGIWALVQQRRKTDAEAEKEEATAADIIQGASKELIEQYKKRVDELIEETIALKKQIVALQKEIAILKAETIALKDEIRRLRNFPFGEEG